MQDPSNPDWTCSTCVNVSALLVLAQVVTSRNSPRPLHESWNFGQIAEQMLWKLNFNQIESGRVSF